MHKMLTKGEQLLAKFYRAQKCGSSSFVKFHAEWCKKMEGEYERKRDGGTGFSVLSAKKV